MFIYTLKRLALAVAVTLVVSALSFGLLYLSGDPAAAIGGEAATDADIVNIRKIYGFDRPIHIQYRPGSEKPSGRDELLFPAAG
jgi:peptide/nickel transport system permease protein